MILSTVSIDSNPNDCDNGNGDGDDINGVDVIDGCNAKDDD
jgi:hypothetical protein